MMSSLGYNFVSGSYKTSRNLTSQEIHLTEKAFKEADEGNKGFLCCSDVKVAVMILFGHKVCKSEVTQLLSSYGLMQESNEMGLNLVQFTEAMKPKFNAQDEDERIRDTFMACDRTCRGFLTVEDVKIAFKQVCPHLAEHRVELAFKELDRDGDGRVSYKDFDFMMKFNNLF